MDYQSSRKMSEDTRPDPPPRARVVAVEAASRIDAPIVAAPELPRPPSALVSAAARCIPEILADFTPGDDGMVRVNSEDLLRSLKAAGHSRAASQWAVDDAVRAGRLQPAWIEVALGASGLPIAGNMMVPGGMRGIMEIPDGYAAPFGMFDVMPTEALWAWWRSQDVSEARDGRANSPIKPDESALDEASTQSIPSNSKRSTQKGDGRAKLIAALTKHHQYADGGCLKLDPIGNNELARQAKVKPSTASEFFKLQFGTHAKYKVVCRDSGLLAAALKLMNGEFAAHNLYGRRPPDEDDRDAE